MENQYNPYQEVQFGAESLEKHMTGVMRRVYLKMTMAMLVTAFVALWASTSDLYLSMLMSTRYSILILFGVEIGLVIWLSSALDRLSNTAASALFYAYAAINGLALAPVCLVYTGASLAKTFFITAGTFGAMSVYGYFTTRDLTRWGNFLFFALIGLIICSLVNIFTRSTAMDMVISAVGVLIFVGLTAWDTWKIKQWAATMPVSQASKLATIGALSLYLDFVNLFLYLLRFFGRRN